MQGLLIVNKPEGMTSFAAVARVRRAAGTKKVGHTGTLDPMATGVLPIFIGRATALSSFLLDADKVYTATFLFGTVTDTDDITGNVLETYEVNITEEKLLDAFSHFTGKITQIPPAFSAIKKDGVPLYKLARRGVAVEVPEREVQIYEIIKKSEFKNNEITVQIRCSKGTYIRALCRDVGEYLGTGATLKSLRRDFTSGFGLQNSVALEDITPDTIENYLIDEQKAVEHLREVFVSEKQATRFLNGGKLGFQFLKFTPKDNGEMVRVKTKTEFLGIGKVDTEAGEIRIKCLMKLNEEKPKTAIALGTFDGVHKGHLAVLKAAVDSGYKSIAVSFTEPPKLKDAPAGLVLTGAEDKKRIIESLGIKKVHFLEFEKIREMKARDFLEFLKNEFNPAFITSGFNYRFGFGGEGNTDLLRNFCEENEIEFREIEPVLIENEAVSSTRIREYIKSGEIEKANEFLSLPFGFSAPVISGDRRGRIIGFPTINQEYPKNQADIRFGVYKTKVTVDGKDYNGITNIGIRPTFKTEKVLSETYIENFSSDIYGSVVTIKFLKFLRDEQKFSTLEELKQNILADIEKIKED